MKINEWSYTSTPLYAFMAWTGRVLNLLTLCVQNIFTHYKTTVSAIML